MDHLRGVRTLSIFWAIALLFALSSCATSEEIPDDATSDAPSSDDDVGVDADPDGDEQEVPPDADDGTDADIEDTFVPDPVDTDEEIDAADPPDTDPGPPDTDEDPTSSCDEVGDECDPRAVYCSDVRARSFCSRCGFILYTEACEGIDICDESGASAVCRPCDGDDCPDNLECIANQRTCADFRTVQVCGADGRVASTTPCSAGRRCFDGSCGSEGRTTGQNCTLNIDAANGCNGHLCVCGTDYRDTHGDAHCSAALTDGYCSTQRCTQNRCNQDSEVCADFSLNGTYGSQDFCVTREGCTDVGRNCGRAGMTCQELPTRRGPSARLEWELACWVGNSSRIGGRCSSNDDCVGGLCIFQNVGGAQVSYCSQICGADAGCPSNATCVVDRDNPGRYICGANANTRDCPRLDSEPLHIRTTSPQARFDGGTTSVCYFPR